MTQTMKAVLCKAFGPPEELSVEEVPVPQPGPGQVRIRVQAAGVNFPDLLMIQGLYQFRPPFPFSPGGEVAGTIDALGEGVQGLSLGQPVIASCGHGGFAQAVVVDAARLLPVPPGMDPVTAAGFPTAYGTSYHALVDRAALQAGEWLLVLGAGGGVGLAAVEIGKALGARVVAAAATEDKLRACRDHGADATINYSAEDLRARLREIAGPEGVDVVYDPVGGPYTEPALRSLRFRGRHLVIGFTAGEIPRVPTNLVLLKGCALVGVFWGRFCALEPERNRANLAAVARWHAEGRIRPLVSRTYALAQAAAALRALAERRVTGKLCLLC